jgi:catechol 2,3-dioxygenase-like lactoylglutathione lyase family enzyme
VKLTHVRLLADDVRECVDFYVRDPAGNLIELHENIPHEG